MKVFYVMVLVLVAGAVPSHGRTESEGTVFNKTQPHESMNNVTVSSSKLEAYGYLYLVMQWPRSLCNSRPCYQQVPDRFTVHGLWPQYDTSISRRGIDCTIRGIFGYYPLFNIHQLDPRIFHGLNIYWPDLTTSENNNQCFWAHEYGKHGSCTFYNQNEYFGLTLRMVERLGDLNRISQIGGRSIIPGNLYFPSDIRDAVYEVTHQRPRLKCITVGNTIQLLEISFCVDRNNNLQNVCNGILDCGNERVYFP